MKKIYLSALALGLGTLAFGQVKGPVLNCDINTNKQISAKPQASGEKALGVVIWSDNFSSNAGWVFENNGTTGPDFGWNIDAVDNSWYLQPIASPSGGAYAEVNNGVPQNSTQAIGVTYTMTSATPLNITDLGGSNLINLEFYQNGARFNDDQYVEISTDGTTFTRVYDNSAKPVLSANGGAAYPNPDFVQVNLAQYLTANPGNFWIRFGWTSAFPSSTNPNAWVTYGWQIDDVALRTLSDNDIVLSNLYYGSEGVYYHQIPLAQIAPIDFSIDAFNAGSATQTGVTLTATETGGSGFVSTSAGASITSLTSETLDVPPFTPPGIGSYTFGFSYSADEPDDVPSNNNISTSSYSFSVGQHIYARDNNTATASNTYGGDPFEIGNVFDIFSPANLTAINVRLAASCPIGAQVYGILYDANLEYLAQTEIISVVAGQPGSTLVLKFENPITLTGPSGTLPYTTYIAAAGSQDPGFGVAISGASAPQTSFLFDILEGVWYFTTSTPVVRMNFDPSLSINKDAIDQLGISVYPNPTAKETVVSFTLQNSSDVSFNMVNALGQTVFSQNDKNLSPGASQIVVDAETLANGVYHFTITTNDATVTRKIVVSK